MAVLSITEASLLRGNSKSDRDGSPTGQRIFVVRFDAAPADTDAVINATGLPVTGDLFKSGDLRTLKNKTPASLGTVLDYIVTCDYEVPKSSDNADPLARPDSVSLDGTSREKPYAKDYSDTPQPVCTSAGEPFDKGPENSVGEFVLTITGNRATLPAALWASYLNPACAVNDGAFTVLGIPIGEGEGKLKGIRAQSKKEKDYPMYFECQWQVACAPKWDQDVDDRGFFELTDDGDGVQPIVAADGFTAVAKPYPLDGSGYSQSSPTDAPAVITFKPQPKKDFAIFSWTA